MLVDGKEIAAQIYKDIHMNVKLLSHAPRLGILSCAPNFETEKYLALKEKKAKEVGIHTEVIRLSETVSVEAMLEALQDLIMRTDGIVVQLPFPPHIDPEKVIAAIPPPHDADALNPLTETVLSPVVGAIAEILRAHEVPIMNQHVTVIGSGKLVGLPASRWFMEHGAAVSVVTKDTADISYYTKNADGSA